jgi:4-amino-4-deoxy-L-arabinose transferase-like glycosyltransferase
MKIKVSNWFNIALCAVICLSIFLRFWNISGLFVFGVDEEYQAHYAATITKDFHLIWIGVSAADTGYYLGPGFTYLNAFLFFISRYDPLILGFFSAFIGSCTVLSVYYISKKLFNARVALIASALYGISTCMIFYDKKFWNPMLIPLISVWLFYSLIQAKKNPRWIVLSAILMGMVYHVHITLWLFWPFLIGTVIYIRKKMTLPVWGLSLISFFGITAPLTVFNLVHKFSNILVPFRMIQTIGKGHTFNIFSHIPYLLTVLGRLWFIPLHSLTANEAIPTVETTQNIHYVLSVITVGILIFVSMKYKDYITRFSLALIVIFLAAFIFYPGSVHEYYLLSVFPLIFLVSGLALNKIKNTVILGGIVMLFIAINTFSVLSTQTVYGLASKKALIQQISPHVETKKFYLTGEDSYRSYEGWRYLFRVYGKTPGKSKMDNMFGWLYQDEISADLLPKTVTIWDKYTDKPIKTRSEVFESGGFKAVITE